MRINDQMTIVTILALTLVACQKNSGSQSASLNNDGPRKARVLSYDASGNENDTKIVLLNEEQGAVLANDVIKIIDFETEVKPDQDNCYCFGAHELAFSYVNAFYYGDQFIRYQNSNIQELVLKFQNR